jgi:N-acetylmuramoyl-L-alanine amidase
MNKLIPLLAFFLYINTQYALSFVVLIDPGHGGEELGAMTRVWVKSKGIKKTKNIYEKDLALKLAKKIKKYLNKKHTTYLTRSIDRTVTLNERANMADTVKADLFISVHFNSSTESSSHGFETYYLDNHADVAIKKVETVENKYLDGADKTVNQILIDLVIQKTVPSSKKLAKEIHNSLSKVMTKKYKLKDRGIKPGLFYVLALSKRPGVLIEAGFMSNKSEIKKIRTTSYMDSYARSIAKGINEYLNKLPQKDMPLF